ncbi:polyprenyl synthetase family protein [Alteribacillus sp. HJP-4]|uniref:polyprenyl synthetase family protein n=1 Tax=Alteribacillus sp. HJP-4 TaxID=2775394 RepID=UPI0035CD1FA7
MNIKKDSFWRKIIAGLGELTEISSTSIPNISSGVDLIFLACDINDDLSDGDGRSRNTITVDLNHHNVLLMEGLYSLSKVLSPVYFEKVLSSLYSSALGQQQDAFFIIDPYDISIPTEEKYFINITSKSGQLCKILYWSVATSHISPSQETALLSFCEYLGISGQLYNDAQDIGTSEKNDLKDLKATLPLIKACCNSLNKSDKFLSLLRKHHMGDVSLRKPIIQYISDCGAIDYTLILSSMYVKKALSELTRNFPDKTEEIINITQFLQQGERGNG